nr:immunoglobulin light chain junction region [Macaca mulatta]
CQQYNNWIGF